VPDHVAVALKERFAEEACPPTEKRTSR
jgi:hypothetical protein